MNNFTFEAPCKIVFGFGEKKSISGIAAGFGKKVTLVTGAHSATDAGMTAKIRGLLEDHALRIIACPSGEPTCETIETIRAALRDFSPDLLVALGGGSVMDTVKAVSGIANTKNPVEDYLEGNPDQKSLEKSGIPWIAMPTTAGTGAEVTKNAVIRSDKQKAKRSFRSPYLLASAAIVDPELTMSTSVKISGYTGIDALVQLLESFVSLKATIMTQSLVRAAFPMMLSALKRIAINSFDREARSEASYASLISGIALANSGLGAVHGFASGVGGMYDIPHGAICASFLIPVLEANAPEIRDKVGFLVADFNLKKKTDPVSWLIEELLGIYSLFGIEKDLKSYSIDKSVSKTIVEKSKGSSMSGNPKKLSDAELENIFLSVI
jgi:alcohol dehydrogenase class IV